VLGMFWDVFGMFLVILWDYLRDVVGWFGIFVGGCVATFGGHCWRHLGDVLDHVYTTFTLSLYQYPSLLSPLGGLWSE
jgi:hypothetical protein